MRLRIGSNGSFMMEIDEEQKGVKESISEDAKWGAD